MSFCFALRIFDAQIPASYNSKIGRAISVWLNASGVGVRRAAATKARTIAYFLFLARDCGVTIPTFVRKTNTTGSSKIAPKATMNFRQKSIYLPTESIGLSTPVLYVRRKFIAKGRTIIKQKRAPNKNSDVAMITNGRAYFFSLATRPGETNFQISRKITGELITIALMSEILICTHNASAGAINTSSVSVFFNVSIEIKGDERESLRELSIGKINIEKIFSEK